MQRTKIEWVRTPDGKQGHSLNVLSGCLHPCRDTYCYAAKIAARFGKTDRARKFLPEFHPKRIEQATRRRKPTTIFLGSAADMWGRWVPDGQIVQVLAMVRDTPQHRYLTLTKDPVRYWEAAQRDGGLPPNLWCGATATDQPSFDAALRALTLLRGEADNKVFVSLEPLHAAVDIRAGRWLDWLIVGRETGPSPAPCKPEWLDAILARTAEYGIPVFLKDNLGEAYGVLLRDLPYLTYEERRVGFVQDPEAGGASLWEETS